MKNMYEQLTTRSERESFLKNHAIFSQRDEHLTGDKVLAILKKQFLNGDINYQELKNQYLEQIR